MKKNILVVLPYFVPEGGGMENYAFQVAKGMAQQDNVFVVCATHGKEGAEEMDGVTIHRMRPTFFLSNTPIKFSLAQFLNNFVDKHSISLIHAHSPVPYFADVAVRVARRKKIPSVLTFHATQLRKGSWTDIIELFYRPILKSTFAHADQVVAVTQKAREGILKNVHCVRVIRPGVSHVLEKKIAKKRSFTFAAQLSSTHTLKGLDVLLESVSKLKEIDFTLYVAGDGDMKEYYIENAKRLGISDKVVFLGWVDREKMLAHARESLALIVPSVSDAEGFPTVMPEAYSVGTAVIGSDVGGISEMVQNGKNGFLVEPGNAEKLAEKIRWSLDHMDGMVEMGGSGKEEVRHSFTWSAITKAYRKVYDGLLER